MVNISLSDPFVTAFSVAVLLGMLVFLAKFMLPGRYNVAKKAIDFVFNVLWASILYFSALHFHPEMSIVWLAGYTAVYLAVIFFRSWRVMKVKVSG